MSRSLLRPGGWSIAACTVLLGAVSGCGSGGLVPVSGTVKLEGKSLREGTVAFYPDESKGNQSQDMPTGEISDGKYEVYTNSKKGAPPGAYKVVVTAFASPPEKKGGTAEIPKSLLASKYQDKATTPLAVEVSSSSKPGAYDLTLTK
jgi:hypothetical protein